MGEKYWQGAAPETDDFGQEINVEFYDAKTKHGAWATMTPESFEQHGLKRPLGEGFGQHYTKQSDGRWKKTQG